MIKQNLEERGEGIRKTNREGEFNPSILSA
jgi:hypothetical protein